MEIDMTAGNVGETASVDNPVTTAEVKTDTHWENGVKKEFRDGLRDYESITDYVKSFNELKGKYASLEERFVVPETYSKLEFGEEELSKLPMAEYEALAKEAGLSEEAYKKVFGALIDKTLKSTKEFFKRRDENNQAIERKMKEDYGDRFDAIKIKVDDLEALGGDEFKSFMAEYGKDPRLMSLLFKLGDKLSDDILNVNNKNIPTKKDGWKF